MHDDFLAPGLGHPKAECEHEDCPSYCLRHPRSTRFSLAETARRWACLAVVAVSACADLTARPPPAQTPGVAASHALTDLPAWSPGGNPPSPLTPEMHEIGEQLYQQRCATCHDAGRAPPRSQIAVLSPKDILEALDTGFMAAIAQFMTPGEKDLLIRHLSARQSDEDLNGP